MPSTATQRLFDTVPKDQFHLFKGGMPDAKQVTQKYLHFKKEDVAAAANVPIGSVRYDDRMPEALLARATEWAIAINLVGSFFKDQKRTIIWFQTSNPSLGNISPKEMIRRGRSQKLLSFIQTALSENPPSKA